MGGYGDEDSVRDDFSGDEVVRFGQWLLMYSEQQWILAVVFGGPLAGVRGPGLTRRRRCSTPIAELPYIIRCSRITWLVAPSTSQAALGKSPPSVVPFGVGPYPVWHKVEASPA